jgi:hypothetical protein
LVTGSTLAGISWRAAVAHRSVESASLTTAPGGFRLLPKTFRKGIGQSSNAEDRDQQATAASTHGRIERLEEFTGVRLAYVKEVFELLQRNEPSPG